MEIDDEDGESLPVVFKSSPYQVPLMEDDDDNQKGVQLYNPKSCTPNEIAQNFQNINETHTTIFAPNP